MMADSPTRRLWQSACAAALCTLVAGLLLWASGGCSSGQRYRVLSLLLDGVPDPNTPQVAPGTRVVRQRGGREVVVYVHQPFREAEAQNDCSACHGVKGLDIFSQPTSPKATICANCHPQAREQYPLMHGPVAVGECLMCHNAHQSRVPHLLKAAAPAICEQCHEKGMLGANPPEHLDPVSNCLDCHVGHGSSQRFLLRANLTTPPAPTETQPAPEFPARGSEERP